MPSVWVSADEKTLVTAGLDHKVRGWKFGPVQAATRRKNVDIKPEWEVKGHLAALTEKTGILAVADATGLRFFKWPSRKPVGFVPVKPGLIVRLRFTPDGEHLAALICRCTGCVPRDKTGLMTSRYRGHLHEHGGRLVVWTVGWFGKE